METLVSRPSFAAGLLDQIAAGRIPVLELSALHARQIRSFGDEQLSARLSEVWGELRDSPQDKADLIAAQMTVEEVRRYIDADSLGYLSLKGMLEAINIEASTSCNACWTGKYPTLIANGKAA